jgi:ABC-type nitrate/sulfonate/bicarbonate transport system substrate-binding protein
MKLSRALKISALAAAIAAVAPLAHAQDQLRLMIGTPFATMAEIPWIVAREKGWAKEAGLAIEEKRVTGDANAVRSLISGDSDTAWTGSFSVISVVGKGADVKALFSWQPKTDYFVLAQKSAIAKVADFADKKVAISAPNSLSEAIVKLTLQAKGFDPAKAKMVAIGGNEKRLQALKTGQVEATILNVNYAEALAGDPALHTLFVVPDILPDISFAWIIATPKAAKDKAAAIGKFTELSLRGARFATENPKETAAIYSKVSPDEDKGVVERSVAWFAKSKGFGVDGGVEMKATAYTVELAMQLDKDQVKVPAEKLWDATFVEAALKKIGTYNK